MQGFATYTKYACGVWIIELKGVKTPLQQFQFEAIPEKQTFRSFGVQFVWTPSSLRLQKRTLYIP